MNIIYEPSGKAREYAPLALNIYDGCEHCCKYCYSPSVLHKTREEFCSAPKPKKNFLERLTKDAKKLRGDDREILISFASDPYQPIEEELQLTRQAIEILINHNLRFTILTKGGLRAVKDFDWLKVYPKCSFGTTLIFIHQKFANEWEPNAPLIQDRVDTIEIAHNMGIKTWVSLEPVIDSEEAFQVMAFLHRWVDFWWVGKINYHPQLEAKIDWVDFREKVKEFMSAVGGNYYLKKSLTELRII
jgi:DNA repair photolyase